MHSLVIFASGAGSNAAAIIEHFKANGQAKTSLIVCNKVGAGVVTIAEREGIPFQIVDRDTFRGAMLPEQLRDMNPSLIVLAGFLWRIPEAIIHEFRGRIINIHPALLPGYGGKGMYGNNVHQAVIAAKDAESGITIHHVNEAYDEGDIILQARCKVRSGDSVGELAARIHSLEHFYYPRVIEYLLSGR